MSYSLDNSGIPAESIIKKRLISLCPSSHNILYASQHSHSNSIKSGLFLSSSIVSSNKFNEKLNLLLSPL